MSFCSFKQIICFRVCQYINGVFDTTYYSKFNYIRMRVGKYGELCYVVTSLSRWYKLIEGVKVLVMNRGDKTGMPLRNHGLLYQKKDTSPV